MVEVQVKFTCDGDLSRGLRLEINKNEKLIHKTYFTILTNTSGSED